MFNYYHALGVVQCKIFVMTLKRFKMTWFKYLADGWTNFWNELSDVFVDLCACRYYSGDPRWWILLIEKLQPISWVFGFDNDNTNIKKLVNSLSIEDISSFQRCSQMFYQAILLKMLLMIKSYILSLHYVQMTFKWRLIFQGSLVVCPCNSLMIVINWKISQTS